MFGKNDNPQPKDVTRQPKEVAHPDLNDSYFQYSFEKGKVESVEKGKNEKPDTSVIFTKNPPPGAVTFLVPAGDKEAETGLKEIEKVNDLLKNPTKLYKWDTENYKLSAVALTTVTPDHSTTALFYTRHLEDIGVLDPGATKKLEKELARSDFLPGLGQQMEMADVKAADNNMDAARKRVDMLRDSLAGNIAHTTVAEQNPERDKANVERAAPQQDSKISRG